MINVIGLGYIGLPTALMFAKSGVEVIGTDLNDKLVDSLSKGKLTFEENGLEDLVIAAIDRWHQIHNGVSKNRYLYSCSSYALY